MIVNREKLICFIIRFDYMFDKFLKELWLVEFNTIAVGMGLHSYNLQ